VDLEVAGSSPVSHPRSKSIQPKCFTLSPECTGCGLRMTGSVKAFHKTPSEVTHPMPRPRKPVPSYLLHKQTGRARAVWTTPLGQRQFRMLLGVFDSAESRTAFAQLQLELESSPLKLPESKPTSEGLTINEMMLAYVQYAVEHYRGVDGKPNGEISNVKMMCKYVRETYGTKPASEFEPLALKAVRVKLVAAGWSPFARE
jgi:hypothetical protein